MYRFSLFLLAGGLPPAAGDSPESPSIGEDGSPLPSSAAIQSWALWSPAIGGGDAVVPRSELVGLG